MLDSHRGAQMPLTKPAPTRYSTHPIYKLFDNLKVVPFRHAVHAKSLFWNILHISPYSSKILMVVPPQPHDSKRSRGGGGYPIFRRI